MVEPNRQTPIVGEANIARYLARLSTSRHYDDDDIVTATRIDAVLDSAAALLRARGDVPSLAKSLAVSGKSHWLVGDSPSVADAVVWSALTTVAGGDRGAAGIPGNVRQWLERCDQLPEFKAAKQFLSSQRQ